MNYFIFLFILISPVVLSAQAGNLVPNSSFEQYKTLPDDVGQGRKCLVDWLIPNEIGKGDYYHTGCSTKKAGTRKNHFGKQDPRTGNAYMGLCITKKYREFLQVKLVSHLIKNSEYLIRVYISCADKAGLSTIDEFNVLFSEGPFKVPNHEDLLEVPKVRFKGDFNNKKEWVELSAIYTANGSESYLTFGSFTYEEDGIKHGQIEGVAQYAHYYVDDVSVTLLNKATQNNDSIRLINAPIQDSIMPYVANATYVFDKLLFESGKSVLIESSYPELDELIQFLHLNPQFKLMITGHTDNVGSKSFNKKLSYERANAVKAYLVKNGINANSIAIEGKGDTVPLMSNDTEEGRKINRRVEISIIE